LRGVILLNFLVVRKGATVIAHGLNTGGTFSGATQKKTFTLSGKITSVSF
jgi:hypothetical protein